MPDASRPYVLVVDDDGDIRETLAILLTHRGFRTITARDGAEALACLRCGTQPCVILLDLMMPGMNGREFRVEQLRDPSIASIPVVAISGAGKIASAEAVALGVDLMRKPIDLATILATVRRYCGG